jgi:hypothetical protein
MILRAELLEDAHLGSGSGGGRIDALIARDRQGRPVIWASHIEGVLRDAARRLFGEDVAADFFGKAGGQQQRTTFTSLYAKLNPESRIWQSTARVAFDNRAPKDDTLRVMEYVPKGTRFEGLLETPKRDFPLLLRLIQEVDAVGAGRATGSGRVRLSLENAIMSARSITGSAERLVLLLRNLDPVCITATATPDNLIPSLTFVPGRALLGAIAKWLLQEDYRDAANVLVGGRVSVSDALPLPCAPEVLSKAEVLPAPLSLKSEKPAGSSGPVPWWAQAPAGKRRIDGDSAEAQGLKLKRPEDDLFVYRSTPDERWIAYRPQIRVRLRNGRPDPTKPDPSLFAIEQIVEDTLFLCELRGAAEDMLRLTAALKPVLEGRRWLRVGRAGAPVEVRQIDWGNAPTAKVLSSPAILTLTSDLLVRDEYLRWRTNLDNDFLLSLPGWPADLHVSKNIQDSVAVHGFNGTSRLWRMPAYAIRRGSMFRVEGDGVAELARMVRDGRWLGERTHEGFGRFRIDQTLPGISDGTSEAVTITSLPSDDPDDAVAVTTRQWLKSHRALAKAGGESDRRPGLSQWFDLVAALERNESSALSSRLNPKTAGGKSWCHSDANQVLRKLEAIEDGNERTAHARLFVRWLRAEMRRANV